MFDEWSELIPSQTENAAIAFHYAEPLSNAPQAILMAVTQGRAGKLSSKDVGTTWNYGTLLQVLEDTVALVKTRVTTRPPFRTARQVSPNSTYLATRTTMRSVSFRQRVPSGGPRATGA